MRVNELTDALGNLISGQVVLPTFGLFRRVALVDIEDDFRLYHKNLIPLGSQVAALTAAIVYCLQVGITELSSGFTGYQVQYPEQKPQAIQAFKEFSSDYGINYHTPVYSYLSEEAVKYDLLEFGLSTKSLEAVSIFSDTFSEASPEIVTDYILRKLPLCRKFIEMRLPHLIEKSEGERDAS